MSASASASPIGFELLHVTFGQPYVTLFGGEGGVPKYQVYARQENLDSCWLAVVHFHGDNSKQEPVSGPQAQMSVQAETDLPFIVFEGSSPQDVSHARQLWSSLSLLPPLESRLVSADIRQRLPVSRPQRGGGPAPEPQRVPDPRQRQEERQRYAAMGDQRKEILALLRRQRERRIQKELLSVAFKPKGKVGSENKGKEKPEEDSEEDRELVRQLQ